MIFFYLDTHTLPHTHVHTYTHANTQTHTHTYIYTYTHTHTHTLTGKLVERTAVWDLAYYWPIYTAMTGKISQISAP